MAKFVGICVVLFVLAVGLVVVNQPQDMAALFEAFRSEPLAQKLAWFLVVLIPLALIPSALWLADALLRQRRANDALEQRLGGVRQGVRELTKSQVDADASVHHLARTDPEGAIGAVTQRLTDAERVTQVQESRSEIGGDLQSRVDELRTRQQALRDRLVPVLEKRRSIEQLFADLDSRESDIERSLAEIVSGDDATAIEVRLNNLMEFVRRSHERCDDIEQAAKTIGGLKEDFAGLQTRLEPQAAAQDGIRRRVKDLDEAKDRLAAEIAALQQTPQGSLAERVQTFAEDKKSSKTAWPTWKCNCPGWRRCARTSKACRRISIAPSMLSRTPPRRRCRRPPRRAFAIHQSNASTARRDRAQHGYCRPTAGEARRPAIPLVPLEATDGGVADLIGEGQRRSATVWSPRSKASKPTRMAISPHG